MTGYTKLFSSLVASTIWREPHTVRIVWITMLAMANKSGVVEASMPGLADFSRVTMCECEEALAVLETPDPHSRTPEHEGRRIAKCCDGWQILNHAKYRAKMGIDERREYLRIKQRERRACLKPQCQHGVIKRNGLSTLSTHAEAEAEAEVHKPPEEHTPAPSPSAQKDSFELFWQRYPKKRAKGAARKAWKRQKCEAKTELILAVVDRFKISEDWTKDHGTFIPYPATWLNAEGWNDEVSPRRDGTVQLREDEMPQVIRY